MRIYQRYDWGRLARFHVLDDRQYRAYHACARPGRGGSNSVTTRNCPDLLKPQRSMLGEEQQRGLQTGLDTSPARWNILAQQTLMAQASQVPILRPGDERIWTDGWDGYMANRSRMLASIVRNRVDNPVFWGGDIHSFWVTDVHADGNNPDSPVVATEFVGTSVTSDGPPFEAFSKVLPLNPHVKFFDSRQRGYVSVEVDEHQMLTQLRVITDPRDPAATVSTLKSFVVASGRAGAMVV